MIPWVFISKNCVWAVCNIDKIGILEKYWESAPSEEISKDSAKFKRKLLNSIFIKKIFCKLNVHNKN